MDVADEDGYDDRAPPRRDVVRGRSETVWRFTEERDGHTHIHLETLVDPRGGLPTWVRALTRRHPRRRPTRAAAPQDVATALYRPPTVKPFPCSSRSHRG